MATLANVHATAAGPPTTPLPGAPTPGLVEPKNGDLLQYITRSIDSDEEFHFLRFGKLQRTNLVALHMKLVRTKDALSTATTMSDDDLEILRVDLEQYGEYPVVASYRSILTNSSYRNPKLPLPPGEEESELERREQKRITAAALLSVSGQRHGRI